MGDERAHAIIVSSWNIEKLDIAHKKATGIFGQQCSGIVSGTINGVNAFFIGPDGSKEGWPESDEGDRRRAEFVAWLIQQEYSDSSNALTWAEVQYADDEGENRFIGSSDMRRAEVEARVEGEKS